MNWIPIRLFIFLCFAVVGAKAQVVDETLSLDLSKLTSAKSKNQLSKLREFEKSRRWGDCAKLGKSQFAAMPELKGWVLITWVRCARQEFEEKKKTEDVLAALAAFEKNNTLVISGSWKNALWKEVVSARLSLIENLDKSAPGAIWQQLDLLSQYNDRLDADAKSRSYFVIADLSQRKHNLKAAQHFLQLSLSEKENKPARDKLNSVELALNEKPNKKEIFTVEALSEGEKRFEDRMQNAVRTSDWISFLEDAVSYLNQYPNGRRAKNVGEKIYEVFTSLQDARAVGEDKERSDTLKDRAMTVLEKADSNRLLEWSRWAHRKNDFKASLRWSEKALKDLKNSPQSAILHYVAGRSAQLLGDYKKARKYFEAYVDGSSGGDDFNEVLFRLALVNIREAQWASAVAALEKLLVQKTIDRYELSARYWLVRSLQALGNDRAKQEADDIIKRFPFSYYGIRLLAEKNNNEFSWPAELKYSQDLKSDWYLTPVQKKTLNRIDQLTAAGWYQEAASEIIEMPTSFTAKTKILLAHRWAKAQAFPMAIKLVNEAVDLDPNLRAMDLVSVSLPKIFADTIENEAKVYALSPLLVRSLIRQESAFSVRATSSSNALGLMQLIPPTAQEVADSLKLGKVQIPEDVYEPDVNIRMGTYYIAKMIRQFGGSVPLGLASYNAGPARMQIFVQSRPDVFSDEKKLSSKPIDELWFDELPWFETSFYVKAILRNTILYRTLDQGRTPLVGVLWQDLAPAAL